MAENCTDKRKRKCYQLGAMWHMHHKKGGGQGRDMIFLGMCMFRVVYLAVVNARSTKLTLMKNKA